MWKKKINTKICEKADTIDTENLILQLVSSHSVKNFYHVTWK